ncbi:MAG: DUF1684 domain-containing protein [Dehalococcoidia bacterium]|nr:DUF1684 domain-containing protein [Dehalococcoidia bacterium]
MEYFAENSKLEFVLAVEEFPTDSKDEIQMATSTEDTAPHTRWGQLTFEVDGVPVALTLYRSAGGDDYFLPFMDATSRDGSYTDGRYLYLPASGDGRLLVGFNYAYNACCAYNPHWSCPIPTSENRLTPMIDAGKKAFPDAEGHERH